MKTYKPKTTIIPAYHGSWFGMNMDRIVMTTPSPYYLNFVSTKNSIHTKPINPYSLQRKKYKRIRG